MIFETVVTGECGANCYILGQKAQEQALIIDPNGDPDKIKKILSKHKLKPGLVINTHGHFDHISANAAFGVPVAIHKDDLMFFDNPDFNLSGLLNSPVCIDCQRRALVDNEKITLRGIELQVLHTPGHTPGGISLLLKKPETNILFSGDTLFYQGIGRTDLPGGSSQQIVSSIKNRLFVLADHTQVYPGHGQPTTIGEEKKNNPFV